MTNRLPTASEQDEARELGHPISCAVMALPELPPVRFAPVEADQSPFETFAPAHQRQQPQPDDAATGVDPLGLPLTP